MRSGIRALAANAGERSHPSDRAAHRFRDLLRSRLSVPASASRPPARVECARRQPAEGHPDRRDCACRPSFGFSFCRFTWRFSFRTFRLKFTTWTPEALLVLFIFSLTLMCVRIAGDMVRFYGDQIPGATPVSTLTQTLAQLGVVILGFLIILNQLHVSIAPILTALGVGGLAVALALQDTLSNLFAGFYVAVAGQVRLGDYIKLDTGEEGYVTDISWRTTTIRTLGSSLIIVPNSKLAKAVVTNYHLPEKRISSQVQVNVSYDSDPDKVERVLLEIGTAAAKDIPGMLAEPAPSVAFDPGFGESSLGFTSQLQCGRIR